MQLMQAGDNSVPVSITLEQAQRVGRLLMQGLPVPTKTTHEKAIMMQYGIASDALLRNQSVIFAVDPVLGVALPDHIASAVDTSPSEQLTSET